MMMIAAMMFVMVAVTVSTTFGLEGGLDVLKVRPQATQHIFYYVIGPDKKNMISNLGRQVTIAQVPCQAHQLNWIFVSDFDNILHSCVNLQPSPIVELQPVPFGHCDRFWKIKKNIVPLIPDQPEASAMTLVKIEGKRARCLSLRPMPGREINGSTMHRHIST